MPRQWEVRPQEQGQTFFVFFVVVVVVVVVVVAAVVVVDFPLLIIANLENLVCMF